MSTPQKYDDSALVLAVNEGSTEFRGRYLRVWYTIQPGEKKLVPWHAMRLWHGNPFAVDIDRRRRYRTDEYERVRAKWGVYEHEDKLDRIPKLRYYDMETEERWYTVADDPEGERTPAGASGETAERNLLSMVQKLNDEIAALKEAQGASDKAGATTLTATLYDQEDDEPIGGPEVRPKGRKAVTHDAPPE